MSDIVCSSACDKYVNKRNLCWWKILKIHTQSRVVLYTRIRTHTNENQRRERELTSTIQSVASRNEMWATHIPTIKIKIWYFEIGVCCSLTFYRMKSVHIRSTQHWSLIFIEPEVCVCVWVSECERVNKNKSNHSYKLNVRFSNGVCSFFLLLLWISVY